VTPDLSGRYYNSYHQCYYDFSPDEPQCAKLKQWSDSMCPEFWVSGCTYGFYFAAQAPCHLAEHWRCAVEGRVLELASASVNSPSIASGVAWPSSAGTSRRFQLGVS